PETMPLPSSAARSRERGNPRKRPALKPLEEGTARRRYVGEFVRDAGGIQGRDRVAAASDGNELAFLGKPRRFLRKPERAFAEGLDLKCANRAIPQKRFGGGQTLRELLNGTRPSVQDHHIVWHLRDRDDARCRSGLQLGRNDGIHGQNNAAAGLGSLRQ